jgi:hypothetical protein
LPLFSVDNQSHTTKIPETVPPTPPLSLQYSLDCRYCVLDIPETCLNMGATFLCNYVSNK